MRWTADDSCARACRLTGHFPCTSGAVLPVQSGRFGWQSRLAEIPAIAVSPLFSTSGPLAQLVEQQTLNLRVRGSSPWRLTNINTTK